MQKLIILDSETGVCHIHHISEEQSEDLEITVEELGYNSSSCMFMVALEIEDNTK